MGARDYWDRMLVYFGIAEEAYDDGYDDGRGGTATAVDDGWDDDREPAAAQRRSRPSAAARRRGAAAGAGASHGPVGAGVGVVPPRTFNDAQKIADQFKRGMPVIVNLQSTDGDLAKRLIDFASGLTYGVDGRMQRIADKVFLLVPPDVEVSAEERAAMVESGFFNQS